MYNPVSANRGRAWRVVRWQGLAVVAAALGAFVLARGNGAVSAGVFAGGFAVVAGCALSLLVALGGGIQGAMGVFGRLVFGTVLRWAVVALALLVVVGALRLPPLSVLIGVVVAELAFVVTSTLQTGMVPRE